MKLPRCPNHLSCYLQTLSNVLIQAKLYAYNVGMITLGVSGLLLCYTLNSARLLLMAAFCYFTQSFGNLLFPQSKAVFTAIGLLSTLEITLPLWLLMKGVNIEQWKKRALAAA